MTPEPVIETEPGVDRIEHESPAAREVILVRRRVEVLGVSIAYREERDPPGQPPLVLIHGLGMSSRSWRPILPLLCSHFHTLAPDLPGAGHSDKPAEQYTVDTLVTYLVAWLDAVGIEKAAFVGHSLGGQVVMYLAHRYPERVSRAVLVAATPDPDVMPAWRKAWWLAVDGLLEPPSLVMGAVRDYLKAHPGRMWRTLLAALRSDVDERAAQVPVPVLVVRGERDYVVRDHWGRHLTRQLPDGRYLVIPGGTHGLPGQSPEELASVIRDFLLEQPGALAT